MEKYVVWFLGANASGKSTLSAKVQLELRKLYPRHAPASVDFLYDGEELLTRTSRVSANLGKFNHPILYQDPIKTNACCGTDTLPKKEMIEKALGISGYEPNNIKFIFVEGIMATRQWLKLMPRGYKILLVLLDIELEYCLGRLIHRRSEKKGLEPSEVLDSLTEKTIENISGKINGFRRMFNDLKLERDITTTLCYRIDDDFDSDEATRTILNTILNGKI